jgi:hypothetical protein
VAAYGSQIKVLVSENVIDRVGFCNENAVFVLGGSDVARSFWGFWVSNHNVRP